MKSDIATIRRTNLKAWLAKRGKVPPEERSYFSQLLSGGSFGERAARRLEEGYKMGHLFLDTPPSEPNKDQAPGTALEDDDRTELVRVNRRELRLLTWFHESTERGKELIEMSAKTSEKESLAVVGSNKSK